MRKKCKEHTSQNSVRIKVIIYWVLFIVYVIGTILAGAYIIFFDHGLKKGLIMSTVAVVVIVVLFFLLIFFSPRNNISSGEEKSDIRGKA
jgi:membrane protein YdbS with pleckstrin-like domain